MSWYTAVRWVHVLAATSWVGEVVTINLVLVPAMARLDEAARGRAMLQIFPRIFRLASFLSATAVVSGALLFHRRFSGRWEDLLHTASGNAFLLGAAMGLALTAFHFVLEPRLEAAICTAAEEPTGELAERVMRTLRVVPRVGLGVIAGIATLMMVGARGC